MMRIAQVAPLHESVPPPGYGGTERIVSYLTEKLVEQGHEVTLFATGDSVTRARLIAVVERALRLAGIRDGLAPHCLQANVLLRAAEGLQARFEESFWCKDLGFYAAALDGEKKKCHVRASNVGHLLYSRMTRVDRACEAGRQLLGESFFSGWGIRTVAAGEARYNPMSYHNGSIWPHDNSLIAAGLARYGMKEEAMAVFDALFEVARHTHLMRLPELFCGFPRRSDCGPIRYPVACSPQAWASGAVFLLLQACLGLEIDASNRQIHLDHPVLPPSIDSLAIENIEVAGSHADLLFERHPADVVIRILRRTGPLKITVTK